MSDLLPGSTQAPGAADDDELERILGACRDVLAEPLPAEHPAPPPDATEVMVGASPDSTTADEARDISVSIGFDEFFADDWTRIRPGPADSPSTFGRYAQTQRIGKGGMAEILRAYDPDIRRDVAIKVSPEESRVPRQVLGKFLTEAQVTGQLEHPNIVPVYDLSRTRDGRTYFSMKLVRGKSLAQRLHDLRQAEEDALGARPNRRYLQPPPAVREAYPLTRRLNDFLKVLDAIAYAHSRGVIHRDLKPSNIMIGEFGEVLVMDWGLAKVLAAPDPSTDPEFDPRGEPEVDSGTKTLDGTVVGTPVYMPPEQAEGSIEEVDHRSDIYSLGATLYELLTLRAPFKGSTKAEILQRVVRGDLIPPCRRAPHWRIPRELQAVVLRAMAPDMRLRYERVEDFKRDIEDFLEGRPLRAARYTLLQRLGKWIARNRVVAGSMAAILVAAVAIALVSAQRDRILRSRLVARTMSEAEVRVAGVEDAASLGRGRVRAVGTGEVLGDGTGGGEYWESIEARRAREESLEAYLDAVGLLEEGLTVAPGDRRLVERRRAYGLELGRIALMGRNFALAQRAFEDLRQYDLPAADVERLLARVEEARSEIPRWRASRLRSILLDLQGGLFRPGRDPAGPLLDDYVLEALHYRDEQTIEFLAGALEPLIERGRTSWRRTRWTPEEIDVATFACRVLGSIGLPAAVDPLARFMAVVWHPELAVECGLALCNTRQEAALDPLLAARARLADDPGRIWSRIQPRLNRVPRAAVEAPIDSAEGYLRRGDERTGAGDWAGAIADYTLALELAPDNPVALARLGRAEARLGKLDAALERLDRALEIEPRSIGPLVDRADIRQRRGEFEQARADLEAALVIEPGSAALHDLLGVLLRLQGEPEAALARFTRALELGSRDASVFLHRAETLESLGDVDGAIRDYGLSIDLDPTAVEPYSRRAAALLERGDLNGALRDLTFALSLAPVDPDLLFERARVRIVASDLAGALADLERAIEIDRRRWRAWTSYAFVLRELERPIEALAALEHALQLAPAIERPALEKLAASWRGG